MNLEHYRLKAGKNLTVFEFESIGPKGRIVKVVEFAPTDLDILYNLAFGDLNTATGSIDDIVRSGNGDSDLILATVVAAVYAFTDRYTGAWIFATGSTTARTRMYRMGISRYFDDAIIDFDIFGRVGDDWVPFQKNMECDAFVLKRKFRNFEQ